MSFATRAAAPATTPSVRWSFPTSFSERASGSSSTTPTAAWETFTDEIMRGLLASSLHTSSIGKKGWKDSGKGKGSTEGDYVDWLTFADNAKSVVADVKRIKSHPLVPKRIPVYGYIYDVKTGRLKEIKAATAAGKA